MVDRFDMALMIFDGFDDLDGPLHVEKEDYGTHSQVDQSQPFF